MACFDLKPKISNFLRFVIRIMQNSKGSDRQGNEVTTSHGITCRTIYKTLLAETHSLLKLYMFPDSKASMLSYISFVSFYCKLAFLRIYLNYLSYYLLALLSLYLKKKTIRFVQLVQKKAPQSTTSSNKMHSQHDVIGGKWDYKPSQGPTSDTPKQ